LIKQLIDVLFSTTEIIVIAIFAGESVDEIVVVDIVFSQVVTTVSGIGTRSKALTFSIFSASGGVNTFDGGGRVSFVTDTLFRAPVDFISRAGTIGSCLYEPWTSFVSIVAVKLRTGASVGLDFNTAWISTVLCSDSTVLSASIVFVIDNVTVDDDICSTGVGGKSCPACWNSSFDKDVGSVVAFIFTHASYFGSSALGATFFCAGRVVEVGANDESAVDRGFVAVGVAGTLMPGVTTVHGTSDTFNFIFLASACIIFRVGGDSVTITTVIIHVVARSGSLKSATPTGLVT